LKKVKSNPENKNLKTDKKNLVESLSSHLFWDVDRSTLSENDSDNLLIHRVIEYGIMNDWKLIQDYYGLDYIKKVATQLKNLDEVSLAFLCTIFHIEKTDFRCYKHKLSSPHFWNY
jgi:hypothetical protein